MENFDRKAHWETVFNTKALNEVSWYEPIPETSLKMIKELNLSKTAHIIDIGGGDSLLVDYLLELGYKNISVLDISKTAILRAQTRLGNKANEVNWIQADSANFTPTQTYDLWHDRASFHFLTNELEISHYLNTAQQYLNPNGILIIGTFSEQGPKKCSGIEIKQYSEITLTQKLRNYFNKITCFTTQHKTPFDTLQHFIFCSFKKL